MTVAPLFGWEHIVVVLALAALVAAAWLVIAAARGPVNERSEWHAWLDARSRTGAYPVGRLQDRIAVPVHPSRRVVPSRAPSHSDDADPVLLRSEESTT